MYRLTSIEDLQSAKCWFDRYLPRSAILSQWLKVTIDRPERCGTTTADSAEDDSVVVYVNAWPKPDIIAGVNLQRMYGVRDYPRILFFSSLPHDDAKYENMAREFINRLNRVTRVAEIGGVTLRSEERWRSLIDTIYAGGCGGALRHSERCRAYWLREDERNRLLARSISSSRPIEPPPGFKFRQLTLEDAEYVESTWPQRITTGGVSLSWVRRHIQHFPSVCLTTTGAGGGQPASFEMTCGTLGIMSHLYTAPQFRRRGLGTLVERRLAQILLGKGHIPCKMVVRGNDGGQAITDAAGTIWQYFGDVFWAEYGDEKMAEQYKTRNSVIQ